MNSYLSGVMDLTAVICIANMILGHPIDVAITSAVVIIMVYTTLEVVKIFEKERMI